MTANKGWSLYEIHLLQTRYADTPVHVLAGKLGRSVASVRATALRLGLTRRRLKATSLHNHQLLAGWLAGVPVAALAKTAGTTTTNIYGRLATLGLPAYNRIPAGADILHKVWLAELDDPQAYRLVLAKVLEAVRNAE